MNRVRYIWPRHARTVGAMLRAETAVKACCTVCGLWQKAPLRLFHRAFGPGYCLINKSMPCARHECPGRARFYVQAGQGVPFRPMRDPAFPVE